MSDAEDMAVRPAGSCGRRSTWRDAGTAVVLAAVFIAGSWWGYGRVAPAILHPVTFDHWFESDVPNVKVAMLDRWSGAHWRAGRHPLAPITQYTPTFVLHRIAGVPEDASVGLVTALFGAMLGASLFVLLRVVGLRRVDAVLFTLLAGSSAALVFWAGVPELYLLTGLSLVPILALAAKAARGGRVPLLAWIAAAALTLGFSTNCWAVGLVALLVFLPIRKAVPAGVASLLLVLVLWRVEKLFFPGLPPFLAAPHIGTAFLFTPLGGGPLARLWSYLFHAMVIPAPDHAQGTYLTVQRIVPGTGGAMYRIALAAWVLLLGGAVWAAFRGKARRLSAFAGLALLSQLVFYQAFGMETFLYSAESVPLFLAFLAPLALTRWRRLALVAAAVFVVAGGVNNVSRFRESADDIVEYYAKERAFTQRIAALTDPDLPLVYGGRVAAAEGMVVAPAPPEGEPESVWYFRIFPDLDADRKGWQVCCDHWSVELIESYRARGAAYFVSSYSHGLEINAAMLEAFSRRYELLERTPDWVIFALHPETGG